MEELLLGFLRGGRIGSVEPAAKVKPDRASVEGPTESDAVPRRTSAQLVVVVVVIDLERLASCDDTSKLHLPAPKSLGRTPEVGRNAKSFLNIWLTYLTQHLPGPGGGEGLGRWIKMPKAVSTSG